MGEKSRSLNTEPPKRKTFADSLGVRVSSQSKSAGVLETGAREEEKNRSGGEKQNKKKKKGEKEERSLALSQFTVGSTIAEVPPLHSTLFL
tara:strand:+ start:374 stop:646 length:273 start_codon:yes stop_codon:yes gene_type:complete